MERNPGQLTLAALAIAALLGAAACERNADTAGGGLSQSQREDATRSAETTTPGSTGEQTAAAGSASTPGSAEPGSPVAAADSASSGASTAGAGEASPGVSGYTGPAGSSGTTGSTAGGTSAGGGMSGSSATTGGTSGSGTTAATGSAGQTGKKLSSADRSFVREAAEDGMFEVAAARLAAEKATDPQVKSFASKLVDQHSQANEQLKQIADAHGMTLPATLPASKQRQIDRLNSASGMEFDRQFLQTAGVTAHREAVKDFEKASRSARNSEVKDFARTHVDHMREHLATSQQLASSLGTAGTAPPAGYTGPGSEPSAPSGGAGEAAPSSAPGAADTTSPQGFTGGESGAGSSPGQSTTTTPQGYSGSAEESPSSTPQGSAGGMEGSSSGASSTGGTSSSESSMGR